MTPEGVILKTLRGIHFEGSPRDTEHTESKEEKERLCFSGKQEMQEYRKKKKVMQRIQYTLFLLS
jgi:hypothetical protein